MKYLWIGIGALVALAFAAGVLWDGIYHGLYIQQVAP